MTKSWYSFKFKFALSKKGNARWYLDLLVIDIVFREIVYKYSEQIGVYRFHRRWLNDKDGHQLSLIVYTTKPTFNKIKKFIQKNEVIKKLEKETLITRIQFLDESKKEFNSMSDSHWPVELQDAWPSYASGISIMLLRLMSSIRRNTNIEKELESEHNIFGYYNTMDNKISKILYSYGQHGLLHHLHIILGTHNILVKTSFKNKLKSLLTFKKWIPMKF